MKGIVYIGHQLLFCKSISHANKLQHAITVYGIRASTQQLMLEFNPDRLTAKYT